MKKAPFIILLSFLLLGSKANAQFNKPLQSSNNTFYSNQAKYNIGLIGGATSTYWLHIGGTKTAYKAPFNFGITGGLVFERMLKSDVSVGIEGLYSMRNTQLNYYVLNYPISMGLGPEHNKDFYRQLDASYIEVNVQIPLTYYFGQASSNIRPFVFAAPRFTLPLSGKITWQKTQVDGYGTPDQQLVNSTLEMDTVDMTAQNMRPWNVGLVAGGGVLFKINFPNYYLLIKADLAAHSTVVNSFSHEEATGESQNVIGASYIDPYLMSYRFNTDVTARLTIMFPLKKQLKGACMRWGEYD